MQHTETLLTLAEVATAFAGFASIVGVFRKRGELTLPLDAFRFRGIIENCLVVLAFSLLPLIVHSYALREGVSWRISTMALLVVYACAYTMAARRLSQMLRPSWIPDLQFALPMTFVVGITFISVTLLNS